MSAKARIGVIGAGWWAVANHIPVLRSLPACEIVAVSRLGAAELAEVQTTFGIDRGFEDYREMLDRWRWMGSSLLLPTHCISSMPAPHLRRAATSSSRSQ